MKYFSQVFIISTLVSVSGARGALIPPDLGIDPTVQLVQSVPAETDLAQPGVALTTDVWIDMIRGAKSSIDLAQFYLSSQSAPPREKSGLTKRPMEPVPMEAVIEELEKATKRGVRIRLLLSQSLLNEDPQTLDRFKKMRGASVRVYDLSKLTGGVHHAKYWIVDQKEIFVGSQNFDWRSLTQIHELGVRVQDSDIAKQLTRIFELDWRVASSDQMPSLMMMTSSFTAPILPRKLELVASPPSLNPTDTRSSLQVLMDLIQSAKSSLKIQLLDYSPVSGSQAYWPELDNALRAAALRGVKIQMLVSNGTSASRAIDYLKSLNMIPGVEIKRVTIPLYSGGPIPYARMIHSKYMVVDNSSFWIGTSNWSKGYFYNSRNVELVFRRPDLAQSASSIFDKLWNYPYSEKIDLAK